MAACSPEYTSACDSESVCNSVFGVPNWAAVMAVMPVSACTVGAYAAREAQAPCWP
jgi:hypothetical protein